MYGMVALCIHSYIYAAAVADSCDVLGGSSDV